MPLVAVDLGRDYSDYFYLVITIVAPDFLFMNVLDFMRKYNILFTVNDR